MKSVLLLTMLTLTSIVNAQRMGLSMSAGYAEVPITRTDVTYRKNNHAIIGTLQANVTNKSKYPIATASLTYGYVISTWQPYVGYSTEGLSYGVNKYIDGIYVIGVGMNGNTPNITFGATSQKVLGKDLFTGNDYAIMGSQFVSGFARGIKEAIQAGRIGKGRPFWDMQTSWTRKWKNGDKSQGEAFFGSSTIFAFTTDGYHLFGTISNVANVATLTISLFGNEKLNWKTIGKKVLISIGSNAAGFYLAYEKVKF